MLEPLKTIRELVDMSGLTQSEICRRTGIDVHSMSYYYHDMRQPHLGKYILIHETVRKELELKTGKKI